MQDTLDVRPVTSNFVAEVSGVDLRRPIGAETLRAITQAIDRYAVLVFRDQALDDDQQVTFSENFGPLEISRHTFRPGSKLRIGKHMSDISNLDENNRLMGRDHYRYMGAMANRLWHTDSAYKRVPAIYSLLSAHRVPSRGGETEFADLRAAYDALPDRKKAQIEGMVAEHSIFNSRATVGFTDFTPEERAALPPVPQVLTRVHPGSGRKTLYLASHAGRIYGLPGPEGRMLLLDLIEHATQRQFVHIHRWRVRDLVMWDNRCTMHRGREYDMTEVRDLRRTTVSDVGPTVERVPEEATACPAGA